MSEPIAWACIWLTVGIGVGRLWQLGRDAKVFQERGRHLQLMCRALDSDLLRAVTIKNLRLMADRMAGDPEP